MSSTQTLAPFAADALHVRAIEPKDAIGLWRMFHRELGIPSPFSFMSIARHCAELGVVAERDGDVIGFAIGTLEGPSTGRVAALCVAQHENATEVSAALLGGLIARPAFRAVRTLAAKPKHTPLAANVFAALGSAFPDDRAPLRGLHAIRGGKPSLFSASRA
jgi:hypothetical protein